jgi:hypothetical protein
LERCETYFEDYEIMNRMEGYQQGEENGRDEELVFFPGEAD